MKKQNKTSSTPLNWWFGSAKDVIGYYIGKSPVVTKGDVVELGPNGWVISDNFLNYRYSWDAEPSLAWDWTGIGDGGKKTLNVTKKEDIKFDRM